MEDPPQKAIRNLIGVIGNKALADISGDDMLDFREWWMDRIETEGLTGNSANKDLIHIGNVLKTVNRMKRLGLRLPLDGLNDQARAILHTLINTGMGPSEVAGLAPAESV